MGASVEEWKVEKLSALERRVLLLTAGFLLFTAGYFLGESHPAPPYQITISDTTPLPGSSSAVPPSDASQPDSLLPGEKINVNTASSDDLQRLPGIGPVKAQAILDYRADNGPFLRPEQLLEVDGIGDAVLGQITDYITF